MSQVSRVKYYHLNPSMWKLGLYETLFHGKTLEFGFVNVAISPFDMEVSYKDQDNKYR